ncbi:hypothetical protein C3489_33925 [Streptomyces sp. Ru71]|uniref:hypothetical protein n=1 Tax=Streptomyces sp. Ru71 TaxID=2080746 RepID=UPI000CDD5F0A|nr:hypothetical protein [Streptomyces sp. Ru71]POX45546.1 hypothetical protein C3489_33925 [Streptomyces sp. Ru71]
MPTLTRPRPFGARAGAAVVLTALAASGASWVVAPAAVAQGENGDIRIHGEHVPYGVSKEDSVVCKFYLDAVNFDRLTTVAYTIEAQPPLPTAATTQGAIPLAGGAGHTDPLGLADGQYKLTWIIGGTPKEKVFRVRCPEKEGRAHGPGQIEDREQHGDAAWGRDQNGPRGGVHAGGGGLIDTAAAYTPVTAAAGVGVVAVGAAVYFRMMRRRNHGAA